MWIKAALGVIAVCLVVLATVAVLNFRGGEGGTVKVVYCNQPSSDGGLYRGRNPLLPSSNPC